MILQALESFRQLDFDDVLIIPRRSAIPLTRKGVNIKIPWFMMHPIPFDYVPLFPWISLVLFGVFVALMHLLEWVLIREASV